MSQCLFTLAVLSDFAVLSGIANLCLFGMEVKVVSPFDGEITQLTSINTSSKNKTRSVKKGGLLVAVNGKSIVAQRSGKIVNAFDFKVGSKVNKGQCIMLFEICEHPAIFAGMCVSCGEGGLGSSR